MNLGPLLYHFNDDRELPSLELSYDELKQAMIAVGFKVIEERFLHDTWYAHSTTYVGVSFITMFY